MVISPADRFVRYKLFTGADPGEVYRQAVINLRIPFVVDSGGDEDYSRIDEGIFRYKYANLPTALDMSRGSIEKHARSAREIDAEKVERAILEFQFSPEGSDSDQELDAETYGQKYGLIQYLSPEASSKLAKATYLWSNTDARVNLCAGIMRGDGVASLSRNSSEASGIAIAPEDVRVFAEFFWDISSLSAEDVFRVLSRNPVVSDVAKTAAHPGSSIRERLGLETREVNELHRLGLIKSAAFDSIERLHWNPDAIDISGPLKRYTEVYLLASKYEASIKYEQEQQRQAQQTYDNDDARTALNKDGLGALEDKAISTYADIIMQRAELAQREEELDFVLREGLMPQEEVEELRFKLENGEDIGLTARDLMDDFLAREVSGSGDLLDDL